MDINNINVATGYRVHANSSLLKVKEDMEAALKILQDKLPSEEFYHAKQCPQRCVPGVDFDDSVECNCKGDSKYMKNSAFQAWESIGNALLAINKMLKNTSVEDK